MRRDKHAHKVNWLVIIPMWPKLSLQECRFDSPVNCLACSYSPGPYSYPALTFLITLKVRGTLSTLINSLWFSPANTRAEKIISCMGFLGLSHDSPRVIIRCFQQAADIYISFWAGPLDFMTISITNTHLFKGLQMDNLAGSAVA